MKAIDVMKSATTRSAIDLVGLGMIGIELGKCAIYFALAYLGWWIWHNTDAWYYSLFAIALMMNILQSVWHGIAMIFNIVLLVIMLISPDAFD